VHDVADITKIDLWFLHKLYSMHTQRVQARECHALSQLDVEHLARMKRSGFSDAQVAAAVGDGSTEMDVRGMRKAAGIVPVVKQIDTMAAEAPAQTNYLYVTYNGTEDDLEFPTQPEGVAVLGSGVYRIGSSVEFDYCGVQAIRSLRRMGEKTIMINYNPETVSTDYDESDRLYFEELSVERVLDIYEKENPRGVMVSVGGQIPNTLALPLARAGVNILGTSPDDIDRAEDRHKFSSLLDSIHVDQPAWQVCREEFGVMLVYASMLSV
jgi:carbamoyl-phosphate synthase large subunit